MDIQAKMLFCPNDSSEMDEIVNQWIDSSVTTAYLLRQQIERPHITKALKRFSGDLWIVIQMFLDTENGRFPLAVTDKGVSAIGTGKGSWLQMLCPRGVDESGISILEFRRDQIREAINSYKPAGISLDFIRHFLFWEDISESSASSSIPRSCFCSLCRSAFSAEFSITLSANQNIAIDEILTNHTIEWEQFSHQTITAIVRSLSDTIRSIESTCKINIHTVPWFKEEFNSARIVKVGQHLKDMAEYVDQISPMCYSPMLKRSIPWISELTDSLEKESELPVIPAIQICPMYGTETLSEEDFFHMVKTAGSGKSAGVIVWPWEQITRDQLATIGNLLPK